MIKRSCIKSSARSLLLPSTKYLSFSKHFVYLATSSNNSLLFSFKPNYSSTPSRSYSQTNQAVNKEIQFLTSTLDKAKNCMLKGAYNEAEQDFQKALETSIRLFGESGQYVGVCYYSLGHVSILKGEKDKARDYYLMAYDILAREPEKHSRRLLHIQRDLSRIGLDFKIKDKNLKDVKQKLQEDLAKALGQQGEKVDNIREIGNIYNYLGSISQQEGRMEEAFDFKKKAIEQFDKILKSNPISFFFVFLDLSIFYTDCERYEDALECITKALKIVEHDKSEKMDGLKFIALQNLGKIHIRMRQYEKAIEPLKKAVDIKEFSPIRDEVVLRTLYHELGMCYFFLKIPKESIQYFEKALEIEQRPGDEGLVVKLLQHIGNSYLLLEGDIEKSKKCFERGLNLSRTYQGKDHPDTKALEMILMTLESGSKKNQ